MAIICTSKSLPTPPSRHWRSHQYDPRYEKCAIRSSRNDFSSNDVDSCNGSLDTKQNRQCWWELPDLSEISSSSPPSFISRLSESSSSLSSSFSIDTHYRRRMDTPLIGEVVASDAAYVDGFLLLPSTTTKHNFDLNEVYLYSERTFTETNPTTTTTTESTGFVISYCHTLRYRGDVVWRLESTCTGGSSCETTDGASSTVDSGTAAMGKMNGISTTCHLTESSLRVRVNKKGAAAATTGGGREDGGARSLPLTPLRRLSLSSCTTRERYDISLHDILHQSAMKYCDEAMESHQASFSSLSSNCC